jgi:hypothetical protein
LPADSDLRGRVAIADAQVAYARYRERFADEHGLAPRRRPPATTAVGQHRH